MSLRSFIALLAAATLAACSASQPPRAATDAAPTLTPTAAPTATSTIIAQTPLVLPIAPEELAQLRDTLQIDGSSTVFPITEAAVRAFRGLAPGVSVRLGVSGTGGGFRLFCDGATIISGASRPIKAEEQAACERAGITFVEVPVAYDGLTVAVHRSNTWATCLTLAELRAMWEPAATGVMTTWQDVRPEFLPAPLHLYGAGAESGTYDYFTAAVVGEEGASRSDYTASEDDYLLAQDLAADPTGLGFFGYAYYVEYSSQIKAVAVDAGAGCVAPTVDTITSGSYWPLSRPLFIYVRADALERPAVRAFVEFYLANGPTLATEARYIPLPTRVYRLGALRLERRVVGSIFAGGSQVGVSVEQLLDREQ